VSDSHLMDRSPPNIKSPPKISSVFTVSEHAAVVSVAHLIELFDLRVFIARNAWLDTRSG
jgi:hypothetical protein